MELLLLFAALAALLLRATAPRLSGQENKAQTRLKSMQYVRDWITGPKI